MEPNKQFIELRKSKGLTQQEFSTELQISRSTVADIERGSIPVSKRVKGKIVQKYGIESGYFTAKNQTKNNTKNQGAESGSKQGKHGLKPNIIQWKERKLDLIPAYMELDMDELKSEMAIEIDTLKRIYEDFGKLLATIYKLEPPSFFRKMFPIASSFKEYQEKLENEYEPTLDQNNDQNEFTIIDKILELYKSEQEHYLHRLSVLIDYFHRYSDTFLDDNDIKEALNDH